MCLRRCNKIKVEQDIVCYKVVCVKLEDCLYTSPFKKSTLWEFGKMKEIKNLTRKNISLYKQQILQNNYMYRIDGCSYHSFKEKDDAVKFIKKGYIKNNWKKYAVLECKIPKNSKYIFEGDFETITEEPIRSYASQKLKPIKIAWKYDD